MIRIIAANYKTYENFRTKIREKHGSRLTSFTALALIFALFSDVDSTVYGMMTTALTILTGFTFTALFSDHSLADVGLPPPQSETHIADREILKLLARNFQDRSTYFIALSIVDVCLLIILSVHLSVQDSIIRLIEPYVLQAKDYADISSLTVSTILRSFLSMTGLFLFFECVYTFYRLSDSIIAIVNIRRAYLRTSE
jgi:hypothetical protein